MHKVSCVTSSEQTRPFPARVQRIAPAIDAASRMRTVEAQPTAADATQLTEAGLIGAIVHVHLRTGDET
ncbi:MAG TPA: hypothetical protein VFN67_31085 [Polyangiales bacterium]|nr:hypothetical protein [Polyangiales bacterium]